MPDLTNLNQDFGLHDALRFESGPADLPQAVINSPLAQARLALQGAQVLSWQPRGQQPVIWLSDRAVFAKNEPVRGGIPLCWPWFGPREGHQAHGFARTSLWTMQSTRLLDDGRIVLELGLSDSTSSRSLWDHGFDLRLRCTVGTQLELALCTHNRSTQSMTITQALHSYFCVGDIQRTQVLGLAGGSYLDKTQGGRRLPQVGEVQFNCETDRIYTDTSADCVIVDSVWGRRIRVAKTGSHSTVVWNPWVTRAAQLPDMEPDGWPNMLCVETCNAGTDLITLPPGQQHTLSLRISLD
jgi:glucose-6-phosphate 1-epimerase